MARIFVLSLATPILKILVPNQHLVLREEILNQNYLDLTSKSSGW